MGRLNSIRRRVVSASIKWWTAVFLFFFFVGTVGHYFQATQGLMLAITPWFLLIFGLLALAPAAAAGNRQFFIWGAAALAVTFALEAIGVATGRIFGEYTYGDTLGLKLFSVPLVIGFNWLLVAAGINSLIEDRIKSGLLKSLIVATGAVAFDVILEPVAIRFDYWAWELVHVPLQNYIAWWLIAFSVTLAYYLSGTRIKSRVPGVYVIIQMLFMVSLLPLAL